MRILICGPDGSGKSSIATWVTSTLPKIHHSHYRRTLRRTSQGISVSTPGMEPPRGFFTATAKLVAFAAINLILDTFRPFRNGKVLVMERGWHDQIVHPDRYRLPRLTMPLVRLLGVLQPKYSLAVLCVGDPEAIHNRKPELAPEEIARQIATWRELLPKLAQEVVIVDTVASSRDETQDIVRQAVDSAWVGQQQWRQLPVSPRRMSLFAFGPRHLSARLLDRLYEPTSKPAYIVFRVESRAPRTILPPADNAKIRHLRGLVKCLPEHFVAGAAILSRHRSRTVLAGMTSAGSIVFVKIGRSNDVALRNEARVLRILQQSPRPWLAPRSDSRESDDQFALVTTDAGEGSLNQWEGVIEAIDALRVCDITHGDLAPWNMRKSPEGQVTLIDFEHAHVSHLPFSDLAYFLVNSITLANYCSPRQALSWLTENQAFLTAYASKCVGSTKWRESLVQALQNQAWKTQKHYAAAAAIQSLLQLEES